MLAVERRAIGSTAAESQTKRSLGDNHVVLSMNRTALTGEEAKTTKRLGVKRNFLKAV